MMYPYWKLLPVGQGTLSLFLLKNPLKVLWWRRRLSGRPLKIPGCVGEFAAANVISLTKAFDNIHRINAEGEGAVE